MTTTNPLSPDLLFVATLLAALGCALGAGVFFAFSAFVMPGLARLPPAQGVAAMQSINVTALTPPFLPVFVGTAALCALLGAWSLLRWHEPGAALRLAGSVVYVVGGLLFTRAFNVPRNDALAALPADGAAAASFWPRYLAGWTAWNHVRTVACLLATALLVLALVSARAASSARAGDRPGEGATQAQ